MTILGTVGIADKGTYNPATTYKKGNFVLHNGSSWLVLQNELTGVEPVDDGVTWKYLARGFFAELLSEISATDTEGLLGEIGATVTGQALIDEITDRVATKLLPKVNVVNNQTTAVEGFALDARQGNPNEIDSLAYKLTQLVTNSTVSRTDYTWGALHRCGKLRILSLRGNVTLANNTYLLTMSTEDVPDIVVYATLAYGAPYVLGAIRIGTSGEVTLYNNNNATQAWDNVFFRGQIMWYVS